VWDTKTLKFFEKHGLKPPEHISHEMTPDDISKKVERVSMTNWRQEGNRLICDTEMGPLVNYIPTDLLLTGTDLHGLPVLTKI
jgi:hypothetical protein